MSSFHEVRFPDNIAYGATGGPEFATTVVATGSGPREAQRQLVGGARPLGCRERAQEAGADRRADRVLRARRGKAYGFRFKDWTDYKATGQLLGTGDDARPSSSWSSTTRPGA